MKIRGKTILSTISVVLGFSLIFSITIIGNQQRIDLKKIEYESLAVLQNSYQLTYMVNGLLTTEVTVAKPFNNRMLEIITSLNKSFLSIQNSKLKFFLKKSELLVLKNTFHSFEAFQNEIKNIFSHYLRIEKSMEQNNVYVTQANQHFLGIYYLFIENDQSNDISLEFVNQYLSEYNKISKSINLIVPKVDNYNENIVQIVKIIKKTVSSAVIMINNIILIFSFFTIILVLIVAYFSMHKIVTSIRRVIKFVEKIAKGDFTSKIRLNTNDEIEELASNIKRIISFENILIQIKKTALTLDENYKKIKTATDKVYDSINSQAASVEETSASFEQLTGTISEVAKNTAEAKNITLRTKNKIHSSNTQIRDTISEITLLADSATKIKDIVKIIKEITEQTGLLSLNAAIEAARAGKAGKGFSVVANEINDLAEKSSEAVHEISQTAQDIIEKINYTTKKSEVSLKELHTIESSIENIVKLVQEVADATEQEADGSVYIMESVNHVSKLAQINTESANKIVQSNLLLKEEVKKLYNLVNQFKLLHLDDYNGNNGIAAIGTGSNE